MNLDALIAPLRADVVSGAAQVSSTAARAFGRVASEGEAESAEELRELLGRLARGILDAQPAMAPLVALGRSVLAAVEESDTVEGTRERAREAAGAFRERLQREAEGVAREAARLLDEGATILTLSYSSTVLAALDRQAGGRASTVICLESRPMQEGRRLAERLASRRTRVLFAVDAAAWRLSLGADVVLLGADSVGDGGVVNKIGSCAVVHAARSRDVPVHVLAGTSKLLPPGFPQPTDDARPGEEVWKAPPGVRVWNRYFEAVPVERVTSIVTEEGPVEPGAVGALRESLAVPEPLRQWAEERAPE